MRRSPPRSHSDRAPLPKAIADFLSTEAHPPLDGILHPSVQHGDGKSNVVLFHKSARVEEMIIPAGTEISARLGYDTEEGMEAEYYVTERVPTQKQESQPTATQMRCK
jgi:hypothetical protein